MEKAECVLCRQRSLVWDADYNAEEVGIADAEGIVSMYHCENCKAQIQVYMPSEEEE